MHHSLTHRILHSVSALLCVAAFAGIPLLTSGIAYAQETSATASQAAGLPWPWMVFIVCAIVSAIIFGIIIGIIRGYRNR